jgi:hypothetical protein
VHSLHKIRIKRGEDIYPAAALLGHADQSDKNIIHREERILDDYYFSYIYKPPLDCAAAVVDKGCF